MLVRIVIAIALLLMAALGPGLGIRRGAAVPARDHRRATVLILRILAGLLGLWLLFFTSVQLLHGHGKLLPSANQQMQR